MVAYVLAFGRMSEKPEDAARSARLVGALAVALAMFAFLLPWYRSFLGITTDGWFFFFAEQVLAGKTPYRDFFLFAPPLHVFELAGLIRLFGESVIAVHVAGLLQRAMLAVLLYLWLQRTYRMEAALVAAVTAVVVFTCDNADTVFFYHQDAAFWGVAAGLAATLHLEAALRAKTSRPVWGLGLLSGFLVGLCFLSKQTVGLGMTVAVPTLIAIAVGSVRGAKMGLRQLLPFAAGWSVPVAMVWGWLALRGALPAHFDQVFLRASSKGSLDQVLPRTFLAAFSKPYLGFAALIAILLIVMVVFLPRLLAGYRSRPDAPSLRLAGLGFGLMLAVLLGQYALSFPRALRYVAVYGALLFPLAAGAGLFVRALRAPLQLRDAQRLLLAGVSFSMAYMFSLSWPAWEAMVVPGLGFLLAEAIDGKAGESKARSGIPAAVIALSLFLVGLSAMDRLENPFQWGEWREPPTSSATSRSAQPALAGIRMSQSTAAFVDTVTDQILRYSRPGDPVFIFPHMPLFYVLSQREPPTFAYVHWFDVAPDYIAANDAQTLLASRPAVLVNYELSAAEWAINEREFRGGRPAGQRLIRQAIASLGSSPDYRIVKEIAAPLTGRRVTVWARHDRIPADDSRQPR